MLQEKEWLGRISVKNSLHQQQTKIDTKNTIHNSIKSHKILGMNLTTHIQDLHNKNGKNTARINLKIIEKYTV